MSLISTKEKILKKKIAQHDKTREIGENKRFLPIEILAKKKTKYLITIFTAFNRVNTKHDLLTTVHLLDEKKKKKQRKQEILEIKTNVAGSRLFWNL